MEDKWCCYCRAWTDHRGYDCDKKPRRTGTFNSLIGEISVLQEAVVKLLESDPQIAGTTDAELEEAVEKGYDPQIRIQAEAILLAREALRITGSLNPPNSGIDIALEW